jgi:hypothetical protein
VIRLRLVVRDNSGIAKLRQAAAKLPGQIDTLTREAADVTETALRQAAPVGKGGSDYQPGSLRRSIAFDLSGTTAEFSASQVAQYVIGGTPAHEIEPREKQALAFYWAAYGDEFIFARVHHPGTKPNDFRVPALERAGAESETLLEDLADDIAQAFK